MGAEQGSSEGRSEVQRSSANTGRGGSSFNFHGSVSSEAFMIFMAGATVAPFLQAVASHFGGRLAGSIDDATRAALSRFLRRELPGPAGDARVGRGSVELFSEEKRWLVHMRDDLPAEAIGQLLALHAAPAPDPARDNSCRSRLVWERDGWLLVGSEEGGRIHRWDVESGNWTPVL